MQQRYVDQINGDDTDTGGSGDPYLTIQAAMDDHAVGGTEIFVQGEGNYTAAFDMDSSGVAPGAADPMIIRNWPGFARPKINLDDISFSDNTVVTSVAFINLDIHHINLTTTREVFGMSGSTYGMMYGCKIVGHTSSNAIHFGTRHFIEGCYIEIPNTGASYAVDGNVTSAFLSNCYIKSSAAYGWIGATNAMCRNNIFEIESASAGIRIGNHQCAVFNNIVVSTDGAGRGVWTVGVENDNKVCGNYVEGGTTSYELNDTRLYGFQDNLWYNMADPIELFGLTMDASNFETDESWLIKTSDGLYAPDPRLLAHWAKRWGCVTTQAQFGNSYEAMISQARLFNQ